MAKATRKRKVSFEHAIERLEELVTELEGGELTLDESLARYEEGREMIRRCYALLEGAERRIEELLRGEDGQLEERPLENVPDEDTTEAKE